MKLLGKHFDLAIPTLIITAFILVAAERLGTVPVPEGDEAFTLQVPYEMLYRGKLALPMLRYLGGNIENVWHSFTPVYFVILSGFLKLFGFGLTQGRAFNLLTAATTLLILYLIGRRMFDWRAGLMAIVMMVGDQTFLERSRLLRNDYAAATFALLAFYLYEMAEERKSAMSATWLYVASGLAAGAGVMCHTNILYMLIAIGLLILLREGLRELYLFAGSALAVMAYEIIYDIVDYKNFLLQNRGDELHFRILSRAGLWQNLVEEQLRYGKWYAGTAMFPGLPQATLHIFQMLTVAAIVYLVIVCVQRKGRGGFLTEPRARLLIVTTVVVLFHALIVSHKRIYYMAHLAPWFALSVGVLLRDGLDHILRWPRAALAHKAAIALVAVAAFAYSLQLVRQNKRYLDEVRNPDLASFEEFTSVIRDIIPAALCPVAVKNPSIWLAFPEKDRCFATIERRMSEALDIEGRDYALVTRPNALPKQADGELVEKHHLLGEMRDTPYGNLLIYYTGRDPRYLALEPKRYRFFGERRGYIALGMN
jgi:4-amino-4-deoxy-L-arabinose transferase-like glycosyltransferase